MFKSFSFLLVVVLAVFVTGGLTFAQVSPFKLDVIQDGFAGEYSTKDLRLSVDHRATADSSVSQIKNAEGQVIAESLIEKNIVTITIGDVALNFNLNQGQPTQNRVSALSESDTKKLAAFLGSEASAPIRIVLAELFKQKDRLTHRTLQGFLAMAMVVGEGPGAPPPVQAKVTCRSSSVFVQKTVSFRPFENARADDDCLGCCGPCYWGCTGCYTQACLAHDLCLGTYPATSEICMAMLALAINSTRLECPMV